MIKKKDISKEDIEVWNNYIKDPQDIVDKDIEPSVKKITKSSVMVLDAETNTPQAVERTEPLPRMNPSLLVNGHMMYVLGGILEVGDREVTLDDFWAVDLRKREKWECIWKGTMHTQVWRGAIHDDDDSYISTGKEDNSDYDDDYGSSDEEALEVVGEESPQEKKSKRKSKRSGIREEIAELNETYELSDSNRTPNTGESLADFYSRTSGFWNDKAAEDVAMTNKQLSNKELKREGFKLAKDRFDELSYCILGRGKLRILCTSI